LWLSQLTYSISAYYVALFPIKCLALWRLAERLTHISVLFKEFIWKTWWGIGVISTYITGAGVGVVCTVVGG